MGKSAGTPCTWIAPLSLAMIKVSRVPMGHKFWLARLILVSLLELPHCVSPRFRGVVGYHTCLTHRRSPVRSRTKPFHKVNDISLRCRNLFLDIWATCSGRKPFEIQKGLRRTLSKRLPYLNTLEWLDGTNYNELQTRQHERCVCDEKAWRHWFRKLLKGLFQIALVWSLHVANFFRAAKPRIDWWKVRHERIWNCVSDHDDRRSNKSAAKVANMVCESSESTSLQAGMRPKRNNYTRPKLVNRPDRWGITKRSPELTDGEPADWELHWQNLPILVNCMFCFEKGIISVIRCFPTLLRNFCIYSLPQGLLHLVVDLNIAKFSDFTSRSMTNHLLM